MALRRLNSSNPALPASMVNPWGERMRCLECADTGLIPLPDAPAASNFADIGGSYMHCPECAAGARMAPMLAGSVTRREKKAGA